ncbi:MAG TPA: hypothetical protein VNF68_01145 [Candidatus Baltobacteraceae bacterium]|nr:hypothetical protein [Candidatus Baltobacteraceae bacterium]
MNAPATGNSTTSVTVAYNDYSPITMQTFDGANGTGTLLGEVTAAPSIQLGKANTIDLTVVGIATSATLSVVPNQPLLVGDATAGYTLLGDQPELFDLVLKDADGNVILTDRPQFITAGASTVGAGYANASGSQISFFGVGLSSGYEDISLQFQNPDGTTLSLPPVKIKDEPLVAVINGATNTISMFDGNGNAVALPSPSFQGLVHPTALTYDPCLRTLVVADAGANTLRLYGEDGETYPYTVGPFTGISNPVALSLNVLDADYLVANAGDDTVSSYYTNGPQFAPYSWTHTPSALACLNACVQQVLLSSDGSATIINDQAPIPPNAFAGLNDPTGVIGDEPPNTLMYIVNHGNNTITTYDTTGAPVPVTGSFPGLSQPFGIAYNPSQSGMLVTNEATNAVTAYDLQGNAMALSPGAFAGLQSPTAIFGIGIGQCFY